MFHADAGQRLFLDKIPDTTPVAELLARLVDPARGTENAASRAQLPATARLGEAKMGVSSGRYSAPARASRPRASAGARAATARLGAARLGLLVRVEPSLANAVSPGRPCVAHPRIPSRKRLC